MDDSGAQVAHEVFDAFGERQLASWETGSFATIFGYTGRYFDKATQLQYNGERWYNPGIGRWMSADPLGFAAGDANLNRYVGNSPTNFTDPLGLDPVPGGNNYGGPPRNNSPLGYGGYETIRDVSGKLAAAGGLAIPTTWELGFGEALAAIEEAAAALLGAPFVPEAAVVAGGAAAGYGAYKTGGAVGTKIGDAYGRWKYGDPDTPAMAKRAPSARLRRLWEEEMGVEWPQDPATGRNQDVSHKDALADGGSNDVDNIEPQPHDDHVQKHIDNGDFRRWGARRAPPP